MSFNVVEIFADNFRLFEQWKLFMIDNLKPFPVQMKFLLIRENVESIVANHDNANNPIRIFGFYEQNSLSLIAVLVLTFQYDDDSAEITHLVLDSQYRKTFKSGKIIHMVGSFVTKLFKENNVLYAQSSIPLANANLEKIFSKYGWQKKAILNSYQKVEFGNDTYRRDVIYFEKC